MRARTLVIGLAAAAAMIAIASPATVASAAGKAAASRHSLPAVALHDVNGQPVGLDHYRGRVVMLDFWETWCGGCKLEIPWFIDFQKKYEAEGLTVIGIAMDEGGWKTVKPYMAAHPFNYPIAAGDFKTLVQAFGLVSLPRTLLIDRHGRIADDHTGVVDRNRWEREIQALLREQ